MIYLNLIVTAVKNFLYYSVSIPIIFFIYKASNSEIPGPFLGKLTSLYAGYFFFKGQLHTVLYQLHLQYGPVVQFAPNAVSVINKKDINQLYGTYKFVRSPFYNAFHAGGNSLAQLFDKEEHFNRKKIIKKAYSSKSFPGIEQKIIDSGINPFVKKLTEIAEQNETCDFNHLIHLVYLDIIGLIGFGKYFNAISTPNHNVVKWLKDGMKYMVLTYTFPITEYFGDFFGKKGYIAILDFCKDLIEEAKKDNSEINEPCLLNELLESKDPVTGEYISDNDIQGEMILQMAAGIETTTETVNWTLKTLLKNPDMMKKVVSEIDAAYSSQDCDMTVDDIKKKCPYLEAVLFETMRVFSPTVSFVPRVVPEEGAYFSGYYLPPGMECSYSAYTYHRSSLHWEDPELFKPERFMGPEGIKERSKVLVFLLGPTGCPGRELAWLALFLTITNLLRKFNISTDKLNLSFEYSSFMVTESNADTFSVKVSIRNN